MSTQNIAAPRSPHVGHRRKRINLEKWGWIYMRVSGIALVVLIFGHLFANLIAPEGGVSALDWAFVAGKLADPFWIVWDVLLLWLALIHGANGMRTLTNDYAHGRFRSVLLWALGISTAVLLVLGTLVLTTFDPCLAPTENAELIARCAVQE